jgi:hypothetical protein
LGYGKLEKVVREMSRKANPHAPKPHVPNSNQKHIWKLRAKHDHRRILVRDGETAKFTGTESEAKEWAEAFPGWEPTYV